MQRYETIVIGLGAMGSAAFYHLSKALGPQVPSQTYILFTSYTA